MAEAILGAAFMVAHLGAIFYLLLRERRQPSATLAWLLTLIFLPALGLLFYAVFGTTRARRAAKKRAVAVAPNGQTLNTDGLRNACRKDLPGYMVPRRIVERERLPHNPNGKIDRGLLKREIEAGNQEP